VIVLLANPRYIASKSERLRMLWQRLNVSLPRSGLDLVHLVCRGCAKHHTIALPGDAVLRELLAEMTCPSCSEDGTLKVVSDRKVPLGDAAGSTMQTTGRMA